MIRFFGIRNKLTFNYAHSRSKPNFLGLLLSPKKEHLIKVQIYTTGR